MFPTDKLPSDKNIVKIPHLPLKYIQKGELQQILYLADQGLFGMQQTNEDSGVPHYETKKNGKNIII